MVFKTYRDAEAAWQRFVNQYYEGDTTLIFCRIVDHRKGYMVKVYSQTSGHFLTYI